MQKFRPYVPIDGEVWRDVKGFPGYEISNLGRLRKSWIINSWKDHEYQRGYQFVQVWNSAKRKVVTIHSLVAEAFIGPRPEKAVVHHRDGDKKNNRASNLEYLTRALNNKHARDTGLWQPAPKGADNPSAKCTWRQIRKIQQLHQTGRWSYRQLAHKYGVAHSTIGKIIRGDTYHKPMKEGE